jgi:Na+-transporting NADH:ubiquinone oxidoreductase subunit E
MEHINIFIKAVLLSMIFAYFLGMCSYLAISKTVKKCCGLGLAVTFVLSISVPVCYLLEKYVLKAGALRWLSPTLKPLILVFKFYNVYCNNCLYCTISRDDC